MRWVNEIFPVLPALCRPWLSPRRFSSSALTGSTRKVVAVGTARLSFMLATSLAAGPLMGDAPAGGVEGGADAAPGAGMVGVPVTADEPSAAATAGRGAVAPLPSGRSPTTPLSNRRRHPGSTADGSRRNSSYMACAKPALAVSKTLKSTTFTIPTGELRAGNRREPAPLVWETQR